MSKFKPNTLAVYTAKNHTKKLVEVLNYTNGKQKDILRVIALKDLKHFGKPFNVREDSCCSATELDKIRNLSDSRLQELLKDNSHQLFNDMIRPKLIRAYGSIKMDRPIDAEKHYISPGGYYLSDDKGTEYPFDFYTYCGGISKRDPCVIDIEMRTLDTETFPDAVNLFDHLSEIVAFPECYVYTGEQDDPKIHVDSVKSFTLEFAGQGVCGILPKTPYLTCSVSEGPDDYIIQCTFTETLLKTIQSYPNS